MGVRHVNRGTFITHVDDPDSLPGDVIPDRLDMAALQTETPVDAPRLEKSCNLGLEALVIRVEILRRRCGLAHELTPVGVYFVRRMRCKIFPVAVRGISSSAMKDIDRGRL